MRSFGFGCSPRVSFPLCVRAGRSFFVTCAIVIAPAFAQSTAVPTALVEAKTTGSFYELDGVIQPVKQSTISAQVVGRIGVLAVKAGDKVRAGQVLATIDDREASAGWQRSQAQIRQADAEMRNVRANFERTKDLQSTGFVSKAALDTAEMQLKAALAVREQAVASALQSSISQGFTKITAPYDGLVLQTHAEAGDLAVPGRSMVTVYAPLPLRAIVQVPASRMLAARTAQQIQVLPDDALSPAQWISSVSRSVVPSADPVSQTTEWRLELPIRESANLLPGQQVRVRFSKTQSSRDSMRLIVPKASILRRGELTAVYVVTNGVFSLRAVRLGPSLGGEGYEVLAGLVGGESVALDPIRAGFAKAVASPATQAAK